MLSHYTALQCQMRYWLSQVVSRIIVWWPFMVTYPGLPMACVDLYALVGCDNVTIFNGLSWEGDLIKGYEVCFYDVLPLTHLAKFGFNIWHQTVAVSSISQHLQIWWLVSGHLSCVTPLLDILDLYMSQKIVQHSSWTGNLLWVEICRSLGNGHSCLLACLHNANFALDVMLREMTIVWVS